MLIAIVPLKESLVVGRPTGLLTSSLAAMLGFQPAQKHLTCNLLLEKEPTPPLRALLILSLRLPCTRANVHE